MTPQQSLSLRDGGAVKARAGESRQEEIVDTSARRDGKIRRERKGEFIVLVARMQKDPSMFLRSLALIVSQFFQLRRIPP